MHVSEIAIKMTSLRITEKDLALYVCILASAAQLVHFSHLHLSDMPMKNYTTVTYYSLLTTCGACSMLLKDWAIVSYGKKLRERNEYKTHK